MRPEDLAILKPGASSGSAVEGRVTLVELLGAEINVHLDVAGQPLTAKVPSEVAPAYGDLLRVGLRMEKGHVFDPESEVAVGE